jgi:hypothetical protein
VLALSPYFADLVDCKCVCAWLKFLHHGFADENRQEIEIEVGWSRSRNLTPYCRLLIPRDRIYAILWRLVFDWLISESIDID